MTKFIVVHQYPLDEDGAPIGKTYEIDVNVDSIMMIVKTTTPFHKSAIMRTDGSLLDVVEPITEIRKLISEPSVHGKSYISI